MFWFSDVDLIIDMIIGFSPPTMSHDCDRMHCNQSFNVANLYQMHANFVVYKTLIDNTRSV